MLYFFSKFKKITYGRKRIQKQFYLLNTKFNQPIPFTYILHYYGPFSRDLHETLESLVKSGLITEHLKTIDNENIYGYELTNEGKIYSKFCEQNLPDNVKDNLNKMLEYSQYKTTDSLVDEVYIIAGLKKK